MPSEGSNPTVVNRVGVEHSLSFTVIIKFLQTHVSCH